MSRVILSASALLALLKKEEGFHKVEGLLGKIVMSSVNVSEAAAILLEMGLSSQEVQQCLSPLISVIVPFDEEQAFYAAAISQHKQRTRLSFGNRACLALGMKMKIPIYTADKAWKDLHLENPTIKFIR